MWYKLTLLLKFVLVLNYFLLMPQLLSFLFINLLILKCNYVFMPVSYFLILIVRNSFMEVKLLDSHHKEYIFRLWAKDSGRGVTVLSCLGNAVGRFPDIKTVFLKMSQWTSLLCLKDVGPMEAVRGHPQYDKGSSLCSAETCLTLW